MTKDGPSRSKILDEDGSIPEDMLLGRVVLFTITDEPTKRETLEKWFDELGLNKDLLPPEIKPIDAFKKATSEAKDKYTLPSGDSCVVLCRDVDSTNDWIKRQITREVRSPRAKTPLSYSRAIEITFHRGVTRNVLDAAGKPTGKSVQRGSERFHVKVDRTDLDPEELAAVQEIARSIVARYEAYYDNLDGNRLRAVVRDYVKYLNAIEIKAGCYFVHVRHSAELKALETLVQRIGGGCFIHTIPLVDVEEQRRMVTAAYEREAAEALQAITHEANALAGTGATPAAYARVKARYDEVTAKALEHMASLQIGQEITGAAAEVALNALIRVSQEVLS